MKRILALDLGIGSYGIALQERTGEGEARQFTFPVVRSCVMPGDWAELKSETTRRRMWRTRQSHLLREKWLRKVFTELGLESAVLQGRQVARELDSEGRPTGPYRLVKQGDPKLEREFPAKGDSTVYAGAALRCLLLLGKPAQITAQGKPLEPWQIFKALHSAIQKRGYDAQVPWKKAVIRKPTQAEKLDELIQPQEKAKVSSEEKDEQESLLRSIRMQDELTRLHKDTRYQRPCFWECWRLNLWDAEQPEIIKLRTDCNASSCKWSDEPDPAAEEKATDDEDKKKKAPVHPTLMKRLPAVFSRQTVEDELLDLCEAAGELLPELRGKALYIIYGESGVAYPNVPRRETAKEEERIENLAHLGVLRGGRYARGELRGKSVEYQGGLGQKSPTFDNRGPGACVLISRFHAAKCDLEWDDDGKLKRPEQLLAAQVSFLLQMKNFRFTPEKPDEAADNGYRERLSAIELSKLFQDHFHQTVVPRLAQPGLNTALTERDHLNPWLEANILENAHAKPGQKEANDGKLIDKPRTKGRSRLSRPAMKILRALLLSGLSPREFKAKLMDLGNAAEPVCAVSEIGSWGTLRYDVRLVDRTGAFYEGAHADKHGMVSEDLQFLETLGDSWEQISIRDERLQVFSRDAGEPDAAKRNQAIQRLIDGEVNPIVRNRLGILSKLLDEFLDESKRPDRVAIEFVRDEFMGKDSESLAKLRSFQNKRRDDNIATRAELGKDATEDQVMRYQMLRGQKNMCLLCGRPVGSPLSQSMRPGDINFDDTHLAHIVSRAERGPNAYNNLTLACGPCNSRQEKSWHSIWMTQEGKNWDAFVDRVQSSSIGGFKKKLLCTKDPVEAKKMVENRAALQQTAWIAKLAQVVVCLKFGWPLDFAGQERRVVIVPGSATNQVASKYGLYRLLGNPDRLAELEAKIETEKAKLQTFYDEEAGPEKKKAQRLVVRKAQDALDDKYREDKRHHALDAMVLSFLPHWAADTQKRQLRFGLPRAVHDWPAVFKKTLDEVVPEQLRLVRSKLAETVYGMRLNQKKALMAVIRRDVLPMPYTKETQDGTPTGFDLQALESGIKTIRRQVIRKKLSAILEKVKASEEKEKVWLETIVHFRLSAKGPLIKKVSCWADKGDPANYINLAKDQETGASKQDSRGQWRRTKQEDRGKWVVWKKVVRGGKIKAVVRSIKVFESPKRVFAEVTKDPQVLGTLGFFEVGCLVDVLKPVNVAARGKAEIIMPKGRYTLAGLKEDARITLESANGDRFEEIGLIKITGMESPNLVRADKTIT